MKKKQIEFLDKNNNKAIIDIEITERNGYPEFIMSGQFLNSYGQCLDKIEPDNNAQRMLINLWKNYHLKDISNLGENVFFWPNFEGHLKGVIEEIEEKEKEKEKAPRETIEKKMEEFDIDEGMKDACVAYLKITGENDLRDFEESYQGEYKNNEDFAQEIAEELGEIDNNAKWPHNCIYWKHAAQELMNNYSEQDGYYFRNL